MLLKKQIESFKDGGSTAECQSSRAPFNSYNRLFNGQGSEKTVSSFLEKYHLRPPSRAASSISSYSHSLDFANLSVNYNQLHQKFTPSNHKNNRFVDYRGNKENNPPQINLNHPVPADSAASMFHPRPVFSRNNS